MLGLLALGLAGCAARGPGDGDAAAPPRQRPERIGLLAIAPVSEVGFYYRKGAKPFFFLLGGGIGYLAAHVSERSDTISFTEALSREGLQPAAHLRSAVHAALSTSGDACVPVDDRPRIDKAVKDWNFAAFGTEFDAVLYVDLSEVAYAPWSSSAYSPKIQADMWLMSTRNGEELGQATYQVRIDPDKTDPRSLLPLRSSRFTGHEELTGAANRAAAALKGELDRIAALIAMDIRTLQGGGELVWEKISG